MVQLQPNPCYKKLLLVSVFNLEEDRNRGGGGWWRKVLVLDVEEAKNQVLFSLPMILTNVFYYAIPLVSVVFAGHLELAGATLANYWATVTVFAFMGLWTGLICGLSMQTSTLLLITLCRNWTGALKDFLGMRTCGGWRRFLFFLPLVFFLPYLLSVLELHENSIVEGLPKKTRTKSDHLVLGPAAGQGLPNRLQCQEKGNGRFPCTWFVGMLLLGLSLTLVEGEGGDHGERVMMIDDDGGTGVPMNCGDEIWVFAMDY
ncbi:hypothetical protein EZV62_008168 [Acer yangbiense]|uniref:Protein DETOXIFICATION n=1 Tax=Acer yangbiense TaxID=1000413 RepID=A0A5C7IBZ4_9ROSI|nr:hypothetical protein EZV62_008168 [Acer yangbiense]